MKIQSIEKYKGNTYRVDFYDGEPVFLNREIISEFNLKEETAVPAEALEQILYASDYRRARERALYLLEVRDYSFYELYNKLMQNYSEEISMEVTNKMAEIGLINDRRYAERQARNLIEVKKYGAYRAKMELQRKGLDSDLVEEILSVYEDDTIERLYELVEKKYARYLTDEKGFRKVKAALARNGYSYADVKAVLAEYSEQMEDDYD